MQRYWREKKKEKKDQRKKIFRPPFFRGNPNTFQPYQASQSGLKATKSLGKRPRKSIKCWGCGGDHLFKNCPDKISRTMTSHNIQEATTGEYVGRYVP